MFEPSQHPRLFGLAPGIDFPAALVSGLLERLKGRPPEDLARVTLIVNTRRMQRRLKALFAEQGAMLLPNMRLITELDKLEPQITLPPAIPALRRRLELIELVAKLLEQQKDLAARSSLYDLADSLAALMDEMQGEGVTAQDIAALDVTDQSGHWSRAQKFIQIAQNYIDRTDGLPDVEARQRQLVHLLAEHWAETPPDGPIIIAGSTGSRGTTMLLMEAVAQLPQGAIVLPGFDFEMPASVWSQLDNELLSEDHPQFRFFKLMRLLNVQRGQVARWSEAPAPSDARNALVSLSLRPAPFTDAWLTDGPQLTRIDQAAEKLTLVEAPTPRTEALAIALRLRRAAEDGQTAALITPDRMLTRQVTAALDQWGILPDDSAGTPLHLSPPGRFLRHVAALFHKKLDAEALLTLLKHPLTHSGHDRNNHLLNTQRLELAIRKTGLPYPDAPGIARVMERVAKDHKNDPNITVWVDWVASKVVDHWSQDVLHLSDWVTRHVTLAEQIARGSGGQDAGELWQKKAGQKAHEVIAALAENADYGGTLTAIDYADLVGALLAGEEVRDRDAPRADIMIWGTLEARVQGADLVILGALNDGTWPEAPKPDPWLNRMMRNSVGLLLPERRIGLSAHDYQQAIAAPEVWLTRSIRSDDAETVASRWLNRLCNLMAGLPQQGGPAALSDMRERGDAWLGQVRLFEDAPYEKPAHRPSPRPPRTARPRRLSVTTIKTLIRDPYAVYARHILKLQRLGDLVQGPDALIRGTVIHAIMERFVNDVTADPALMTRDHLLNVARAILAETAPWPTARAMWLAKVDRISEWFIAQEAARRSFSAPVALEDTAKGKLEWSDIGFTLTARADRIDRTDDGAYLIYDYKTGQPPSKAQQQEFDKQLLIMTAMVEEGAFAGIPPDQVAAAVFIGLGSKPTEVEAPLEEEPAAEVLGELRKLITAYLSEDQGFTSRRMMEKDRFGSDYDQLARFGEWEATDDATPETLK